MKNIFLILSILSLKALAQTDNNSSYYRNLPTNKFPSGSKVVFQKDLVLPAGESVIKLTTLKTQQKCQFSVNNQFTSTEDQIIPAGTEQNISAGYKESSWSGFQLGDQGVGIFCQNGNLTIGELADALAEVVTFDFPYPPKPKLFKFPGKQ